MSNPAWNNTTTSDEVAETLSSDIRGKAVLVTGISPDGLGLDFCRAIIPHEPSLIILAARNASKISQAKEYLKSLYPSSSTSLKELVVDLTSLSSVRRAAEDINSSVDRLDVIVNNAAMHAHSLGRTEDGFEMSFATNHLGHFLLTNLLLKGVMKAGGRVVNVTSNSFRQGGILWEDPNFLKTEFGEGWAAYSQSKTANVLFAAALADKFGGRNVYSYSLHPGLINTAMAKKMDMDDYAVKFNVTLKWKTFPQGTATHVVAAFDPAIEPQNGSFLADCQVKPIEGKEAEFASGKVNHDRLWKLSEELVREKFE